MVAAASLNNIPVPKTGFNRYPPSQPSTLYISLQALPGCEEEAGKTGSQVPSRTWIVNCFSQEYLTATSAESTPSPPPTYSGSIVVGRRQDCHIVLKDRAISTRHATIQWTARRLDDSQPLSPISTEITLVDHSTNGSFVAENRVPKGRLYTLKPRLILGLSGNSDPGGYDEVIFLGKPKALLTKGGENVANSRPVFAFGIGILNIQDQFSSQHYPFFPFPVSDGWINLSNKSVSVKTEPIPASKTVVRSGANELVVIGSTTSPPDTTHKRSSSSGGNAPCSRCRPLELAVIEKMNEIERLQLLLSSEKNEQSTELRALQEEYHKKVADLETNHETMLRKEQFRQRELSQKLGDAEVELGLIVRKSSAIQLQLTQCQTQRNDAINDRDRLGEELERLDLKRKQLLDEVQISQDRIAELEKEKLNVNSSLAKAKSEVSDIIAAHDTTKLELRDISIKYQSLETQHKDVQEVNSDLNQRLENLECACRDSSNHLSQLRSELDGKIREVSSLKTRSTKRDTLVNKFLRGLSGTINSFLDSHLENEQDQDCPAVDGRKDGKISQQRFRTPSLSPVGNLRPTRKKRLLNSQTTTLLRPLTDGSEDEANPIRQNYARSETGFRTSQKQKWHSSSPLSSDSVTTNLRHPLGADDMRSSPCQSPLPTDDEWSQPTSDENNEKAAKDSVVIQMPPSTEPSTEASREKSFSPSTVPTTSLGPSRKGEEAGRESGELSNEEVVTDPEAEDCLPGGLEAEMLRKRCRVVESSNSELDEEGFNKKLRKERSFSMANEICDDDMLIQ